MVETKFRKMQRRKFIARVMLVSMSLYLFASISSLGSAQSTDEPWQSLFNGSDFAFWKVVSLRDPAPAVIEDGAMVLRQRINTVEHSHLNRRSKEVR